MTDTSLRHKIRDWERFWCTAPFCYGQKFVRIYNYVKNKVMFEFCKKMLQTNYCNIVSLIFSNCIDILLSDLQLLLKLLRRINNQPSHMLQKLCFYFRSLFEVTTAWIVTARKVTATFFQEDGTCINNLNTLYIIKNMFGKTVKFSQNCLDFSIPSH